MSFNRNLQFFGFVAAGFLFVGCSEEAPSSDTVVQQAINDLSKDIPDEMTKKAVKTIKSLDTKAFPLLMKHLRDQRLASSIFQKAVLTEKGELAKPTIGGVCFDLIQEQVEGNWPKNYREFHILNPDNVKTWWKKNSKKTIKELRLDCAAESLQLAKDRFGSTPSASEKEVLEFLSKNFKKIYNED